MTRPAATRPLFAFDPAALNYGWIWTVTAVLVVFENV